MTSMRVPVEPSAAATGGAAAPPVMKRSAGHGYRVWFALPAIVMVLFFFGLPFIANAFLAFTRWTGFSDSIAFNGLDNISSLLQLGILGHAIVVTVVYAVITMAGQNVVGLVLAKALQRTGRINTVFRSIFFIPVLISPLAAGYIWAAALAPDGPIDAAIRVVIPGFDLSWLGSSSTALISVGLIDAWKWSGLVTLVYISGLNSISRGVVEASVLDGASAWRRFVAIERPLLAPAVTFNIVLTLVGSFNALDVVFATTGGGPGDATSVLNVAVYNQYGQGLFGTSSALSFMIAVLVVIVAIPLISYLRKREVVA